MARWKSRSSGNQVLKKLMQALSSFGQDARDASLSVECQDAVLLISSRSQVRPLCFHFVDHSSSRCTRFA